MTAKELRDRVAALVREARAGGMSVGRAFGVIADYGNNDAARTRLQRELEPERTKRKTTR